MTRLGLICGVAALALAGCERPAEPAKPKAPVAPAPQMQEPRVVEGFTNQPGLDLFGYYMPKAEVSVGQWRLDHLHVGLPGEFDRWNAGERSGVYAPVLLQFDDVKSPQLVNELGQSVHTVTERVIPDAWRVTETEVAFVDNHPRLGKVSFQGRLDRKALERAKADGGDAPVLVGTLTVGGTGFPDVAFSWFGGD